MTLRYIFLSFILICVCMSVHVCATCVMVPMEARRGHQFPESVVASVCELPEAGDGNLAQALCKRRKYTYPFPQPLG